MLTDRQSQILNVIVEEYIHTATAVSSATVFDKGILDVSCPTIRNEMAALTDMGLLVQPHTSAGRVPTEKGYRFFVDVLIASHEPAQLAAETTRKLPVPTRQMKDRAQRISSYTNDLVVFIDNEDGEVKYVGLKKVLRNPEFSTHASVISILEELERFENYIGEIEKCLSERLEIFIGSENPFLENPGYSMISSRMQDSFIALLGPMRMNYRSNLMLFDSQVER